MEQPGVETSECGWQMRDAKAKAEADAKADEEKDKDVEAAANEAITTAENMKKDHDRQAKGLVEEKEAAAPWRHGWRP